MKNLLALAAVLLGSAPAALGRPATATDSTLEARIIALDQQGWEAWKRNDPSWFEENTTESFVAISSDGISDKAEVVRATSTGCVVAAFSLADFRFVVLDQNAVLLTYRATQDAVCGGVKAPATLRVAVNYVQREGRWLEAMYMQAP